MESREWGCDGMNNQRTLHPLSQWKKEYVPHVHEEHYIFCLETKLTFIAPYRIDGE